MHRSKSGVVESTPRQRPLFPIWKVFLQKGTSICVKGPTELSYIGDFSVPIQLRVFVPLSGNRLIKLAKQIIQWINFVWNSLKLFNLTKIYWDCIETKIFLNNAKKSYKLNNFS